MFVGLFVSSVMFGIYLVSATTTSTQQTCPCSEDPSDQCLIESMFGEMQFWEEEADHCVTDELKADVISLRLPYIAPSYEMNVIETCEQNDPLAALFLNVSNPCGAFRCCVKCQGCLDDPMIYGVLQEEGPVILRSRMTLVKGNQGPAELDIYCAPADSDSPVGGQRFYVMFTMDESCATTGINTGTGTQTTATPLTDSIPSSETTSSDTVQLGLVIAGGCVSALLVVSVGVNFAISRVYKIRPLQ